MRISATSGRLVEIISYNPPDKQEKAIQIVMKQAESLANIWTEPAVAYETNSYYKQSIAAEDNSKYE